MIQIMDNDIVCPATARIDAMFFSFAYLAVRALLGLLVRSRRGLIVTDTELTILRHELDILRRKVGRPSLSSDGVRLAKTASRRTLGFMNEIAFHLRY